MKAKKIVGLLVILSLGATMLTARCNVSIVQNRKPLLSLGLNTESEVKPYRLFGCDSLQKGIRNQAVYFSKGALAITHSGFSDLWRDGSFSIEVWVQTLADNDQFEVIASNKDWNQGEVKDFISNHEFGVSRNSGINKGWAIICQPDGSWAWNIGDGEFRSDYRSTSPRQQINDGSWHQIAIAVSRVREEVRLYFDGVNVAIQRMSDPSYRSIGSLDSGLPVHLGTDGIAQLQYPLFEGALDEFRIYDYAITAEEVAHHYKHLVPAAILPVLSEQRVNQINLMAWNIWHGGRRHGKDVGPQQVIDFIEETKTDIIMMQETYGSGARIADALEYYYYLASGNISIISKFPIRDTRIVFRDYNVGLASIELSKGQFINLASLWIHWLPDWKGNSRKSDFTAQKLIKGEQENRLFEIEEILKSLKIEIEETDKIPLIIGGDFNSPSHKDWRSQTAAWHNNLVVEWPVSLAMENAGMNDSFREVHEELDYSSFTMTASQISHRIDYIYYKGKRTQVIDSDMHFKYKGVWPSDHPAVTTTLGL